MTYDDSNVFAKILRGELPCHKVYEDDETFAFMDIMPRANGHVLVISKTQAVNHQHMDWRAWKLERKASTNLHAVICPRQPTARI